MKHILLTIFVCLLCYKGYVQVDSLPLQDTLKVEDSLSIIPPTVQDSPAKATIDTPFNRFLRNPFIKEKEPLYLLFDERKRQSKDELFYLVTGLVLFLAFNRLVFSKYFANLFRLFFQPTFRQKQTREQLLQNNLPSLFYNLLFILTGGAYITLLVSYFNVSSTNFWLLFLYSSASLAVLYITKFLFLRFSGWVFNVKEAASTYIFIVYLINKVSGIILIPFVIILAFSNLQIISIAVTISLLIVALLFFYRYLISYAPVHKEIKVSPIHFFFYISAFEIIPLLLIYKVLMIYMVRSL
ncbi:MAG TPA: DUF4271 domain-containing protein [Segetibacter sp.]